MGIEFDCVKCGKEMFAQDQFAGRTVQCPDCQTLLSVPVQSGATPQVVQGSVATPNQAANMPPTVPPTMPRHSPMPQAPQAPQTPDAPTNVPSPGTLRSLQQSGPGAAGLAGAGAPLGSAPPPGGVAETGGEMVRGQQGGQEIHQDARMCRFCGKTQDPGLQRQVAARGAHDWPAWRGGRGHIEFGETINVGFAVLKKYWLVGAGYSFIYFVLLGSISLAGNLVTQGMTATMNKPGTSLGAILGALTVVMTVQLISTVISSIFWAGYVYAAIKMVDNIMGRPDEPAVGDLFYGFQKLGPIVGANFLYGLLFVVLYIGAAVFFFIFPPLALAAFIYLIHVSLRLFFFVPCIVDKNMGAVDSLRMSWSCAKGNTLQIFALMLVAGMLLLVSMLALGVGVLCGMVVVMGIFGSMYRQLTTW